MRTKAFKHTTPCLKCVMSWKITTLQINERNIKMEVGRVVIHLSSSRQQSSDWGPSPIWGHTVSASGSQKQPKSVKPILVEISVKYFSGLWDPNEYPPEDVTSSRAAGWNHVSECAGESAHVQRKIKGFNGNTDVRGNYLYSSFYGVNTKQYENLIKMFFFQNKILAASFIPSLRAHQRRHETITGRQQIENKSK